MHFRFSFPILLFCYLFLHASFHFSSSSSLFNVLPLFCLRVPYFVLFFVFFSDLLLFLGSCAPLPTLKPYLSLRLSPFPFLLPVCCPSFLLWTLLSILAAGMMTPRRLYFPLLATLSFLSFFLTFYPSLGLLESYFVFVNLFLSGIFVYCDISRSSFPSLPSFLPLLPPGGAIFLSHTHKKKVRKSFSPFP